MRDSEKAMAGAVGSMVAEQKRKENLRKKFPQRVVYRRGLSTEGGVGDARLGDVRARGEFSGIPAAIVVFSFGFERDSKDPSIKEIEVVLSEKIDAIDAEMARLSKRRKAIVLKAWETGTPVTWGQAEDVTKENARLRDETRK